MYVCVCVCVCVCVWMGDNARSLERIYCTLIKVNIFFKDFIKGFDLLSKYNAEVTLCVRQIHSTKS